MSMDPTVTPGRRPECRARVSGCAARGTAAAPVSTATRRARRPAARPRCPAPLRPGRSPVTTISLADLPTHRPPHEAARPPPQGGTAGSPPCGEDAHQGPRGQGRRRVGLGAAAGDADDDECRGERGRDGHDRGQQQRDEGAHGCADQVPRAGGHRHRYVAAPVAAGVPPHDQRGHRPVGEPGDPAQQHEHGGGDDRPDGGQPDQGGGDGQQRARARRAPDAGVRLPGATVPGRLPVRLLAVGVQLLGGAVLPGPRVRVHRERERPRRDRSRRRRPRRPSPGPQGATPPQSILQQPMAGADSPGRRASYGAITLVRPGATTAVGSAAGTVTVAGAPAA